MTVVTRFAPSPTGYLHIGAARTALFNYLYAKNNGGKFLLRIEDTDEKRSTQASIDAILQGLEWLNISYDGDYVMQSDNFSIHQKVANKLLEIGAAYNCYTSQEELEEMRSFHEKKGEVFRFKSPFRDKPLSQSSSTKPVIRIKAPTEGTSVVNDLIRGKVEVENCEIDDFVILRSDLTPTYNLAVVSDDHDMGVTHVIRGDDHLTNTFKQKLIYELLSWNVPRFAHMPLIHSIDGSKMSKRHDATSVIEYKDMGYLPDSIFNYLLRLGWSHGDAEIISREDAIKWFNIEKVGKSPSRFDFAKLNNLNHHYISSESDENLLALVLDTKVLKDSKISDPTLLLSPINFLKKHSHNLNELAESLTVYIPGFRKEVPSDVLAKFIEKSSNVESLLPHLLGLDEWNLENIKITVEGFLAQKSLKIKDIGLPLRIALTFSTNSHGGLFEVIDALGKAEVSSRITEILKVTN